MRIRQIVLSLILASLASRTLGQNVNPVYTDDSPAARDTLERLPDLIESGNMAQGVHALQKLLDEESDRTLGVPSDPRLFRSVRDAVHERILQDEDLLDRYREIEGPVADQLLREEGAARVERTHLLTSAGFEGALRVAQSHLEQGRFEAANITLAQLEGHPDLDDRAADAADLLTLVARYLDRDEIWSRAQRWSRLSGDPAVDPEALRLRERPPLADVDWRWAFDRVEDVSLPAAPRRPLWTSSLIPEDAGGPTPGARTPTLPVTPNEVLWVLPSATEDAIYTNDGIWITAWDRYTLEKRWRVRPATGNDPLLNDDITDQRLTPRVFGSRLEDPATVTVAGDVIVATTGLAISGLREGDPRVHALEAETGEIMWSALLQRLDPELDQAVPVGTALVDADTVVVAARKSVPGRRIISVALVGLDLYTGELRWIRPIASAGALPYVRNAGHSDGSVLHEGIVIRVDELGVLAAVEAVTGRPKWIRTLTPQDFTNRDSGHVFETNVPIVHDGVVYVRSPNRRSIFAFDVETGELLRERSGGPFNGPSYLVGVGDYLAGVSVDRVAFLPFDQFERGVPESSERVPGNAIRGRVIAMGDKLLAPVETGAILLDPADPREVAGEIALDASGNPLPLGSALIVVDDLHVHSYLDWAVADALLTQRMNENPDDPTPAITYAELAFRAGRAERVPEAASRALDAIRRNPTTEQNREARTRLFDSLRSMVETSQRAWEDPTVQDAVIRDLDVMEQVIARMSRAAEGPRQQAVALLVEGRLRDAMFEPTRAFEAYQSILADDRLAAQQWEGEAQRVNAAVEASRRIRDLVMRLGPTSYAAFEAEARRRAAALPQGAAAPVVESVARQYPASSVAAELWARAAEIHDALGRGADEMRCLHQAVLAARVAYDSDTVTDPTQLALAVRSQVRALAERERFASAAHALHRFTESHPDLDVGLGDVSVSSATIMSELRDSLATLTRPARIGDTLGPATQSFVGWQLLRPILTLDRPEPATDHVVMLSPDEIALFGDAGIDDTGEIGHLTKLWHRPVESSEPALLRLEPDAVYLVWPDDRGNWIECIDPITGVTRWKSEPFQNLFDEAPDYEQLILNPNRLLNTPGRRNVPFIEILVASADGVFALVERTGRVVALDEANGDVLWQTHSPIEQVFEADAAEGVLVVGGDQINRPGVGQPGRNPSTLQAFDIRSGEQIALIEETPGQTEWARVASPHRAIIHTRRGVHAYDLRTGALEWTNADPATINAETAWIFGDNLYMLDTSRVLWHARPSTGRVTPSPVTQREELAGSRRIDMRRLGDVVAVLSSNGVVLLDDEQVVGADGLDPVGGMLTPVPTDSHIVAIEVARRLDDDLRPMHMLHVLDDESLKLERTNVITGLWDSPRVMTAIDDHLVVSAGQITFVFDVPAAGAPTGAGGP